MHGGTNNPLKKGMKTRWGKKNNTLATDNKYAMEEAVLYCPVSLHPLWGKVALLVSTGI